MKFSEIVEKLAKNGEDNSLITHPDCNPVINAVAAVDLANSETLSYIEGAKFAPMIAQTAASALILPKDEKLQQEATIRGIAWIASPSPRLMFAMAISLFYQPFHPDPGIHPTAIIDPSVVIGDGVYIGANVVIQPRVTIGDHVCLHPNVVIYPDVQIGDRSILHANSTIHERTQIGSNCVIHSGAVIGAEGFGFVPTSQGWYKMEQSGYTVLENGVEIGCNSTIDRPAVGETRIGQNTKLDNLIQIGHGCQIGKNCALAAQVGLAGGSKIGNGVILGGQVGVANQITIGDGAIVTAQSGVHSEIPPGEIFSGSPAVANRLFLKVSAIYNRLPEMYKLFKKLEKSSN